VFDSAAPPRPSGCLRQSDSLRSAALLSHGLIVSQSESLVPASASFQARAVVSFRLGNPPFPSLPTLERGRGSQSRRKICSNLEPRTADERTAFENSGWSARGPLLAAENCKIECAWTWKGPLRGLIFQCLILHLKIRCLFGP